MSMSHDGRDAIGRLRRKDVQILLKANNIQFSHSAALEQLVPLIEANGVDIYSGIEWESVEVQQENGTVKIERYPKVKTHATANKNIDYEAVMAQKSKEHEALTKEKGDVEKKNEDLAEQVAKLTALVEKLTGAEEKAPESYEEMGFFPLKRLCKERGIPTANTDKKPDLIEKLNGQDAA